jgi:DNA-binding MarR family transcriptional regulator
VNQDILDDMFAYICQRQQESSFPPSLRELAKTFFMSPGSVIRHLERMEGMGWIIRDPGKARGITLLRSCEEDV